MCTTTDLAKFGICERKQLVKLLNAWREQGLPELFCDQEVVPTLNTESGNVFLTNSEYECAMMDGDELKQWFNCFNCGNEGFEGDCDLTEEGCCCCA